MRANECLDDIRTAVVKLSDDNKKYVIAVAQALLFTQKDEKDCQKKRQDLACFNQK